MDRFIHSQNLIRYVELMEHENDPARRERIHALLVEEASRFGDRVESAIEVDGLIANAQARARRQHGLVAGLATDGPEAETARRVLANMQHMLKLLMQYRRTLDMRPGSDHISDPH